MNITINECIGIGHGCILTIARSILRVERDSDKGSYTYKQLIQHDDFSSPDDYHPMRRDQIAKMKAQRRLG
ncbi:hypothetical protein QBC33DRAFT_561195 [Phialemonium atrogriseum]|uniref:Uncharacterized protein n=1 Tax=Phialemonium atrogriseum TaxID=1093897 RepID=A0AAJ0BVT2_9PEZI|nr:uncharacterized protein QBC33DRAFT_561195 [Phialemonium atrogriseum]KAK1764912.1 hypothetical protein QBC33DRAFT_561195 [Phialemonium atrogriseum]